METLVDVYPSRNGTTDRPYMTRLDPVVHRDESGDVQPGPLSERQLSDFEENGYLSIEGLLGPEVLSGAIDEVARLRRDVDKEDQRVILEPENRDVRSIFAVHDLSTVIHGLCASDMLAGAARQMLGSQVYLHQTRLNFKPGFSGKEFDWHSDFETWHVEDGMPRMRAVSCVVALTDNYSFNGPLMIIPGSHRLYILMVYAG